MKLTEKELNTILRDDETEKGGTAFLGETLADFLEESGIDFTNLTILEVNELLENNGIEPIEVTLNEYTRERTINYLNGMQSMGAFDDFPESEMDFNSLPDDELLYYFLEWYFTETYREETTEEETELLEELARFTGEVAPC